MNRLGSRVLLGVMILSMGGCVPQKVIVWAPDGSKAAVVGGDGLYLCDPAGKLSSRLIPGAGEAAWLPDSAQAVVEVVRKRSAWADVEPFLEESARKRVVSSAERFLREAAANRGPLAEVADRVRATPSGDGWGVDEELATLLYLRAVHGRALRERFGPEWDAFEKVPVATSKIQRFDFSGGLAKPGRVVAFSLAGIEVLRVSPDGSLLAFVTDDPGSAGTCRLFVVPLDGSRPATLVADLTARYPDWSADGRYLVYARANPPREGPTDTLRLGSLSRIRVTDDSGKLLAELPADRVREPARCGDESPPEPPAEVLAGSVFSVWTKVRCLNDGRILFSGAEITLPATAEDMPNRLTLFAIEPGRRATVSRIVSRRAEAEIADVVHQFEVSPDQTRIAIPGMGGRMTVLVLASGEVTEVRPRRGDTTVQMVPAWRNDQELAFAVANEGELEKRRPGEFLVWSAAGGIRTLSTGWPDSIAAALRPADENKPPPPLGRR